MIRFLVKLFIVALVAISVVMLTQKKKKSELVDDRMKILVYSGPGASEESLRHTIATVEQLVGEQYHIKKIGPYQLCHENWEDNTALFIMPGGADIPYTKDLNGKGNRKIKDFVEAGGAYLGICAGSYYGGKYVDFGRGSEIQVMGCRELAFYPGTVRGPILGEYDYKSLKGVRAAKLAWNQDSPFSSDKGFVSYYNGGGYFVHPEFYDNVLVLALYEDTAEKKPAIIECTVGDGKAILSGVHFEYNPTLLDKRNPYLKDVVPQLKEGYSDSIVLVEHLLGRLGLIEPADDIEATSL